MSRYVTLLLTLAAVACCDGSEQAAPRDAGVPKQPTLAGAQEAGVPKQPTLAGSQDATTCSVIEGWALDRSATNVRQAVEILEGDAVLARTEANLFRKDLQDAGLGDGGCAFSIPTPASLKDGKPHTIAARVVGTSLPLPHGPKTITCTQ